MTVRSVRNQYIGINAHLHSLYQAEGGWNGFHTRHIVHIADTLAAELVPKGYIIEIEESLQIRRNFDISQTYGADVLISDTDSKRAMTPSLSAQAGLIPVVEFIDDDDLSDVPFRAISIAPRGQEPIVWIELLSPSNKGKSGDALVYRTKRIDLLLSGIVFVELDYLNETPPTSTKLPTYYSGKQSERMSDAHPYWVVVIDPRPTLELGTARVIGFNVDEPIPTAQIPMSGGETVVLDFGLPYRTSFDVGMVGYGINYAELPLNFERYSPDDQLRIARRMLAVMKAAQNGSDLETPTAPFPVDEALSLEDALADLERLKQG